MRISQRLDYTLRALVLLATHPSGDFVPGSEVAWKLGLPQRVVEQQMSALARAGLLRSRRGAGGGHALARDPSQIAVSEVVRSVQGYVLDVPHVSGSVVSEVWGDVARELEERLAGVTLESLVRRQRELDAESAGSYAI